MSAENRATKGVTTETRGGSTDVLMVIDSFELGGTETFATRAIEALGAEGVRVAVACLRAKGPLLERARASAHSFHELSVPVGPGRILGLTRALRRVVRELRPRAVYAQDVYSNYLSAMATVGLVEPWLVTSRRWAQTQARGRRLLAQWAARRSAAVVANSAALCDRLKSEGVAPQRVHLLPNIVDAAMFERPDAEQQRLWRERLGIAKDQLVVMVAGRLHPDKGQDVALEAFGALPEHVRARSTLVLMGDGVLRRSLEMRVGELGLHSSVRMPGAFTSPPNVFGFADLALLPSRTEGMPNALLEASAVACPVVACDVGGVGELSMNLGCSVLLIPPESAESMTGALRDAVDTLEDLKPHADIARHELRSRHAPHEVVRSLLQILRLND